MSSSANHDLSITFAFITVMVEKAAETIIALYLNKVITNINSKM
jgi:hypothetical protein